MGKSAAYIYTFIHHYFITKEHCIELQQQERLFRLEMSLDIVYILLIIFWYEWVEVVTKLFAKSYCLH